MELKASIGAEWKEKTAPKEEKLNLIEGLLEQVWTAQQQSQKANITEGAQPPTSPAPAEGKEGEMSAKQGRAEKPASVVVDAEMFRQLVMAVKELRTPSGTSSDDEPLLERDDMQV